MQKADKNTLEKRFYVSFKWTQTHIYFTLLWTKYQSDLLTTIITAVGAKLTLATQKSQSMRMQQLSKDDNMQNTRRHAQ